jgi:hypothetical protein
LLPSASGTLQRVVVIDARRAWVVEQHVYDPAGKTLLASAVAESHRYYPIEQVSLPEVVVIKLPTAKMALKINLGAMQISQVANDRTQLFVMPTLPGQQFNLGGAATGTPLPGQGASRPLIDGVVPASYPMYPGTSYPVTPASLPGTPTNPTSASASGLPIYGQKSPASQPARRY